MTIISAIPRTSADGHASTAKDGKGLSPKGPGASKGPFGPRGPFGPEWPCWPERALWPQKGPVGGGCPNSASILFGFPSCSSLVHVSALRAHKKTKGKQQRKPKRTDRGQHDDHLEHPSDARRRPHTNGRRWRARRALPGPKVPLCPEKAGPEEPMRGPRRKIRRREPTEAKHDDNIRQPSDAS